MFLFVGRDRRRAKVLYFDGTGIGASNYTYAEATPTQRLPDSVGSTIRAFEFFGGVHEVLVPDQLRSAVRGPIGTSPTSTRRTWRWLSTTEWC